MISRGDFLSRRWGFATVPVLFLCLMFPVPSHAAVPTLTFRYEHYLFDVAVPQSWLSPEEEWTYNGEPMDPPQEYLVDGDDVPSPPSGFERKAVAGYDRHAIANTIQNQISAKLDREPGSVKILRDATGKVTFDGVGLTGRKVDIAAATELTITALDKGITDVFLPIRETQPQVTVDPALANLGIKEVVTVGESDFSNSPPNRIHNIQTGLAKFNGVIVPPNGTFSFVQTLGPVDGTTGFLKELVIKGDKTVPDYGGGLCQVSSTAYRGAWEYGFPIVARRNHSYIVSHYYPVGTDATVYLPNPDMQFKNDAPTSLLIQTYAEGANAYFVYYGTKDDRQSHVIGPFIWDRTSPPPDRIEPTKDLPPGVKKVVGNRVPGEKVMWYRLLETATGTTVENYYSDFQARPYFYQLGVADAPDDGTAGIQSGDLSTEPVERSF